MVCGLPCFSARILTGKRNQGQLLQKLQWRPYVHHSRGDGTTFPRFPTALPATRINGVPSPHRSWLVADLHDFHGRVRTLHKLCDLHPLSLWYDIKNAEELHRHWLVCRIVGFLTLSRNDQTVQHFTADWKLRWKTSSSSVCNSSKSQRVHWMLLLQHFHILRRLQITEKFNFRVSNV